VNVSNTLTRHSILPTFKQFRSSIVSEAEKHYLEILLQQSQGCIKKACEISELSRTRLYYLMKEHNIEKHLYKKS
jgi:two-component system NtrC family response regulator